MSLLSFTVISTALKIVIGVIWVFEVVRRRRRDWAEFRTTEDKLMRLVILFSWILTIGVIAYLINTAIILSHGVRAALG